MKLTFRTATPGDSKLIYQLADKIWHAYYVPIIGIKQVEYMLGKIYSEQAQKEQMLNGQEYTLAYRNGAAVGYFSLSHKNGHYFLHKLYVLADEHAKGIGTAMFEEILRKCKDGKTIGLTVNRKNYQAINFYFKQGFKIKSVEDFDIGEGFFMNDFVMEYKIRH